MSMLNEDLDVLLEYERTKSEPLNFAYLHPETMSRKDLRVTWKRLDDYLEAMEEDEPAEDSEASPAWQDHYDEVDAILDRVKKTWWGL